MVLPIEQNILADANQLLNQLSIKQLSSKLKSLKRERIKEREKTNKENKEKIKLIKKNKIKVTTATENLAKETDDKIENKNSKKIKKGLNKTFTKDQLFLNKFELINSNIISLNKKREDILSDLSLLKDKLKKITGTIFDLNVSKKKEKEIKKIFLIEENKKNETRTYLDIKNDIKKNKDKLEKIRKEKINLVKKLDALSLVKTKIEQKSNKPASLSEEEMKRFLKIQKSQQKAQERKNRKFKYMEYLNERHRNRKKDNEKVFLLPVNDDKKENNIKNNKDNPKLGSANKNKKESYRIRKIRNSAKTEKIVKNPIEKYKANCSELFVQEFNLLDFSNEYLKDITVNQANIDKIVMLPT